MGSRMVREFLEYRPYASILQFRQELGKYISADQIAAYEQYVYVPIAVNSADAATLAKELDGIGPAKAQAIVEFRQKNGPFRNPEDLLQVDGIGERVLEQNRGNIRLNGAGAAPAAAGKSAPKPASKPAAPAAGR